MFRGPWALCVKRADTSRCHLQRTTTGHPRDDSSIPQLLESSPSKAKPSLARFYACSFANSLASPLLWLESLKDLTSRLASFALSTSLKDLTLRGHGRAAVSASRPFDTVFPVSLARLIVV